MGLTILESLKDLSSMMMMIYLFIYFYLRYVG